MTTKNKKRINHHKANIVFVDLETTGLNPLRHEIIEIGYIVVKQPKLEVIEEGAIKVRPKHIQTASKGALKLNKYNKKDWEKAVPLKKALQILAKKSRGAVFVGHNIWMDMCFLEIAFQREKVKRFYDYHVLDTVSLAFSKLRGRGEEIKHYSLKELAKYFGIKMERPHEALSDARATFEIYRKLVKE